jgi:hypothetical protein
VVDEATRLQAKITELNRDFPPETKGPNAVQPPQDNDHVAEGASQFPAADGNVYKDKAEVIAELTKRGIKFDARKTKANLEELLK